MNEKKLEKLYFIHKEGLPGIGENCPITMELDRENHLLIFKVRSIWKKIAEFSLPISKISSAGQIDMFKTETKTKTTVKPKFAIGRSIIGGAIMSFNPLTALAGAIVGAVSANKKVKTKSKSKNKKIGTIYTINYISDGIEKVIKLKDCKNFNFSIFQKHLEEEIRSQHSTL